MLRLDRCPGGGRVVGRKIQKHAGQVQPVEPLEVVSQSITQVGPDAVDREQGRTIGPRLQGHPMGQASLVWRDDVGRRLALEAELGGDGCHEIAEMGGHGDVRAE